MAEISLPEEKKQDAARLANKGGIRLFDDINAFTKAVESEVGVTLDFCSLVELTTDFMESSEKYLIMNIKAFNGKDPNNLLFLTEDNAFLYSKVYPSRDAYTPFLKIYGKSFGRSTVLAFVTLSGVLDSLKQQLETFIKNIKELEQQFDSQKYRDLSFEFERLYDRMEELHDLLLRLQERGYKQIETRYISFDYNVLIAESLSLQGRCRRRLGLLRDLARDHETEVTIELNRRIEKLNDVVKRLTALTVLLMLPTLIASHFGMNFYYMPELRVPWAYPAVIAVQVILVVVGVKVFRKIGWL